MHKLSNKQTKHKQRDFRIDDSNSSRDEVQNIIVINFNRFINTVLLF